MYGINAPHCCDCCDPMWFFLNSSEDLLLSVRGVCLFWNSLFCLIRQMRQMKTFVLYLARQWNDYFSLLNKLLCIILKETKADWSKNWRSSKQKAWQEQVRTSSSVYLSQLTHDWTVKFLLKCQGFVCRLLTPVSLWHFSSVIIVNFLYTQTITLLYWVEKTAPPYSHTRVKCKNYFWKLKTTRKYLQTVVFIALATYTWSFET